MIWAMFENKKMEATPKTEGTCPLCNERVYSRCGEINIWHWAHDNRENCDPWHEPESFWHKHWKLAFGQENSEIRIEKDGERHIADILTNGNVVIELQNSPISKPIIREREDFYGGRMLWLINGEEFKSNLIVKGFWEDQDYRELISSLPQPPYERMRTLLHWKRSSPEIKKGINGEFFKWKHPRRGWEDVQRPVFIDFGEDSLFRVQEGMGTKQIRGTYVSKEKFIKKYGGNYEDYCLNRLEK